MSTKIRVIAVPASETPDGWLYFSEWERMPHCNGLNELLSSIGSDSVSIKYDNDGLVGFLSSANYFYHFEKAWELLKERPFSR